VGWVLSGGSEKVGSELQALCGRCGDVWHIVIARDEGGIAQVQCGECGARHRYRSSAGPTRRSASKARKRSPVARSRETASLVEADLSRPSRPFSPRDTYQVGDRLVHPTFGEGVVQAVQGATKVSVHFDGGTRLLVQGRPPS